MILMAGPEKGTDFHHLQTDILSSYLGQYSLGNDMSVSVSRVSDHLVIEKTGRPPLEILPVSDTVFYATAATLRVRFVLDERGSTDGLVITQAGRIEFAERMKQPR